MGITNPGEQYFKNGGWGWDGSQWRKLAMVWGYTDVYGETLSVPVTGVGNNVMTFATVPVGEVWVITNISASSTTNTATACYLDAAVAGAIRPLVRGLYPTANLTTDWRGNVYLKAGDYIRVTFTGCAAGDWVGSWVVGYKMGVA